MLKKLITFVMIFTLCFSATLSVTASSDTDLHDLDDSVSNKDIKYLIDKGIVNGIEVDGEMLFMPNQTLTRAQFIKMLVIATGIEVEVCEKSSFSDVPNYHWAINYIEAAKKANYTNGYNGNTFKPENPVSRTEMVTLLVRAYNLENELLNDEDTSNIVFEDIDSSHWAYKYVSIAVASKIITALEIDGKFYFEPSQVVTRGESAVVLSNQIKAIANKALEEAALAQTSNNSSTRRSNSIPKKDITLQEHEVRTISQNIEQHFNQDTDLDKTVNIKGLAFEDFSGNISDVTLEPVSTDDVSVYGTNGNAISRSIPGLTGSVFEFETSGKTFSSATLTFDVKDVSSTDINNLVAVYYNEYNNTFEFLHTTVDAQDKTVSFTTTHNSKYFLIDMEEWEKAWKKEITVAQSVYSGEYIDFSFIIDSSGSMQSNDPNNLRKDAIVDLSTTLNFDITSSLITENVTVTKAVYDEVYGGTTFELDTVVNSVYSDSDRISIIDFDSSAKTLCSFTADEQTVSDAVYLIDSSGGTDIFVGIERAIETYEDYGINNQRRIAVLFTDGRNNYTPQSQHWNIIDAAVENQITIITMGLGDDQNIDSNLLRKIAEMTGGQYYKLSTSEEISDQFTFIQDHTQMGVDSDGDGINDVDEISGLRLRNGMIVHTDPSKADTDGDGINDGDELGNIIVITLTADMLPSGSELIGQQFEAYDYNSLPDDQNSN